MRATLALLMMLLVRPSGQTQSSQPPASDLFKSYRQGQFTQFTEQLALVRNFGDLRKQVARAGADWPIEATAAFLLEVSDVASRSNPRPLRVGPEVDLFEDACRAVRRLAPGGEFEAAWHAAAFSILSAPYVVASRVNDHLGHVRGRHDEGHTALMRAMPEERSSWSEATQVQPSLAGPAQTDMHFELRMRNGRAQMRDAAKLLEAASRHESVRPEATLRQAGLLSVWQHHGEALHLLGMVDDMATDPWLRYLVRLFAGRSLEALGRTADAQAAYRSAVDLQEHGKAARLALASIIHAAGRREEADRLVVEALSRNSAPRDPWAEFPRGDFRFFDARLAAMRERIK